MTILLSIEQEQIRAAHEGQSGKPQQGSIREIKTNWQGNDDGSNRRDLFVGIRTAPGKRNAIEETLKNALKDLPGFAAESVSNSGSAYASDGMKLWFNHQDGKDASVRDSLYAVLVALLASGSIREEHFDTAMANMVKTDEWTAPLDAKKLLFQLRALPKGLDKDDICKHHVHDYLVQHGLDDFIWHGYRGREQAGVDPQHPDMYEIARNLCTQDIQFIRAKMYDGKPETMVHFRSYKIDKKIVDSLKHAMSDVTGKGESELSFHYDDSSGEIRFNATPAEFWKAIGALRWMSKEVLAALSKNCAAHLKPAEIKKAAKPAAASSERETVTTVAPVEVPAVEAVPSGPVVAMASAEKEGGFVEGVLKERGEEVAAQPDIYATFDPGKLAEQVKEAKAAQEKPAPATPAAIIEERKAASEGAADKPAAKSWLPRWFGS